MYVKQWNEAAGILRPEYKSEIETTEINDEIPLSELQNKLAMLSNALVSAQYQLDNLTNPVIDRKTRITYLKKFINSAIDLVTSIREEI